MPEHVVRSYRIGVELILVFALSLGFLLFNGHWSGFEGDDLNSVLPILHLEAALAGDLKIYRPAWQPLSYVTGAAVYALTGQVDAIFALAPLGVASGIALLYLAARRVGLTPVLFLPLLMLFPEILYTGLYFNSSALGFPLVCLAVVLAPQRRGCAMPVLIGALLASAVLMRIDFVLIAPAVVIYRVWHRRDILDFVLIGAAAAGVFILALLVGILDPYAVARTYLMARDEIVVKAFDPGWDAYTKLFVTTVVFSPLGWLFLGFACVWTMLSRRAWMPGLLGMICLAPMLFAARNMLTPKYMIPAFALLPIIAAIIWVAATATLRPRVQRGLAGLCLGVTFFFLFLSVEPQRASPYLTILGQQSRTVVTHDGPRSWGGYLWHMGRASPQWAARDARAKAILAAINIMGPIVIVGRQSAFLPGGLAWRQLQLHLSRAGYEGQVVGPGALLFERAEGQLFLLTPEAQMSRDLTNMCVVTLNNRSDADRVLAAIAACT